MVRIYCRAHHKADADLCKECAELLDYAQTRNSGCAFGAQKPACSHCPIHCFSPEMRGRIQKAMRYAGPRMFWRHPVLAVRHLLQLNRK